MIVYRIENAKHEGMAQTIVETRSWGDCTAWNIAIADNPWCEYDDDLYAHVPPDEDFDGKRWQGMMFGFSSAKQMREWLYKDGWLKSLHKCGMLVAHYSVEDFHVVKGGVQVVFNNGEFICHSGIMEYFGLE